MKKRLSDPTRATTDADLPADEIHLPLAELKKLQTAIPFHHLTEEKRIEPVTADVPPPAPPKRKWHHDHDAMTEDYDTDVILNERPKEPPAPLGSKL
jgi:hypothetical protein